MTQFMARKKRVYYYSVQSLFDFLSQRCNLQFYFIVHLARENFIKNLDLKSHDFVIIKLYKQYKMTCLSKKLISHA